MCYFGSKTVIEQKFILTTTAHEIDILNIMCFFVIALIYFARMHINDVMIFEAFIGKMIPLTQIETVRLILI